MRLVSNQSHRVAWVSEAHLRAGRPDDALGLAGRALDLARAHKERGSQAWALRLLGEISSSRDPRDAETAEDYYLQGLALATELEMRPLVAHCHAGLGRLYARTGDRVTAQEHLTTAATLYRQMDMGFWLKQAEAELTGPPA
jgi:tetratricopeptide (TPR) repeat protein